RRETLIANGGNHSVLSRDRFPFRLPCDAPNRTSHRRGSERPSRSTPWQAVQDGAWRALIAPIAQDYSLQPEPGPDRADGGTVAGDLTRQRRVACRAGREAERRGCAVRTRDGRPAS